MHDDPQLSQPYDTVKTIRVIYTPVQRRAWTQETFSVDATTTLHQLIKKVVSHQNRSAYDTLDEVVLLSPAYIPEFKKLIGKKTHGSYLPSLMP